MCHLDGRPAELKEHNEGSVVEELLPLRPVRAEEAGVEDERKAAGDEYGADEVPDLPAAVVAKDADVLV